MILPTIRTCAACSDTKSRRRGRTPSILRRAAQNFRNDGSFFENGDPKTLAAVAIAVVEHVAAAVVVEHEGIGSFLVFPGFRHADKAQILIAPFPLRAVGGAREAEFVMRPPPRVPHREAV